MILTIDGREPTSSSHIARILELVSAGREADAAGHARSEDAGHRRDTGRASAHSGAHAHVVDHTARGCRWLAEALRRARPPSTASRTEVRRDLLRAAFWPGRHYHARVRRSDFAYHLPEDLIAQTPLAERSASRLLALDGSTGALRDRSHPRSAELVRPGDLLVFNDTRVVAARLVGSSLRAGGWRSSWSARLASGTHSCSCGRARRFAKSWRSRPKVGRCASWRRRATYGKSLCRRRRWNSSSAGARCRCRRTFIARRMLRISERYQSIFAQHAGAVAAPTACLHFDEALIAQIEARGVQRALVTLHVGAGTFQPVRTDDLESHVMHAERVSVSAETCEAIERTRAAGGRVVAIGTTVARALEAAPRSASRRRRIFTGGAFCAAPSNPSAATPASSSRQAFSSASSTRC